MTKRTIVSLISILIFSALVLAHGKPIMGTVTEVTKDSVTVKDTAGKTIVVTFENATKFLKNKKAAQAGDIQVGDRVVIDAHEDAKTKKLFAEEVQIGTAAAPAAKGTKKP
jgi:uncharacterized protein DUF5666